MADQITSVAISSAAETAAIIIAASIPFLRLAIKKVVPSRSRASHAIRRELVFSGSTGGSGGRGSGRGSGGGRRVRAFASELSGGLGSATGTVNRVVVETRTGGDDGNGDDASDRSTLDDGHLKAAALDGGREGIMWTREVTVEHHDRRDVESLEEKTARG